jgi:hypothetical protein
MEERSQRWHRSVDPRWEIRAHAFVGAGMLAAPVKFFPNGELAEARA